MTVSVEFDPISFALVLHPVSFIAVAVGPGENPLALHLPVLHLTLVDIAVLEDASAAAVHLAEAPVPFQDLAADADLRAPPLFLVD